MKRSLPVFCLVVLLAILAGCTPAASTAYPESAPQARDLGAPAMEAPAAPAAQDTFTNSGSGVSAAAPIRIVIKNADISVVVADPGASMDVITKMADSMGGFVVSSNLYKTRTDSGLEVPQASITVRVPAERLDEALSQIRGLTENPADDVLSENTTGQDVTKEYTDLKSRLRNLEDAEAQLREIMASATKTEDVMNVYNQITYVREQIEVTKGQIQYYEESAALSAINVSLISKAGIDPLTIGGWKPVGVARDALQTLIDILKFLVNVAIFLVIVFVPVGLIIGLPVYFIVRALRRRRKVVKPFEPAEPNK